MRLFCLLGVMLLVGCGDKNAPSAEKFEQLIKASSYATKKVCPFSSMVKIDDLPGEYSLADTQQAWFNDFRTLEKFGYVQLTPTTKPNPFTGKPTAMVTVSKAAKWKAIDNPGCPVEWQAQRVKDFTPPGPLNGLTVSSVTVEGTQHYTDWATVPELRKIFHLANLPTTAEHKYLMVLKNTGWQVAGVD